MAFFDTHAHLNDEQLSGRLDEVLANCQAADVCGIVCIGIDAESSELAVQIAEKHAPVFAAIGIQPNYVSQLGQDDWEKIKALASHPKVIAIGETGLDRYWDYSPFDLQQVHFRQHIEFAIESNLPFVVHMRDCAEDIVELLNEYQSEFPLRGIMHSYSGDLENAEACLDIGLHISFAGMVTYKKSDDLRQVAKAVPLDRLLIETDAPYLSPHPKRGHRPNEPALVTHTASCLAELHGISTEELGRITTKNAVQLFGIEDRLQIS